MKVAIIYNKDIDGVINTFGIQNKEFYNEETIKRVARSLEGAGHNVAVLDGNKQIIDRLENFMPRVVEGEQMGMIFNMAYGIQGESRYTHIPSMLEMLGLPYVGSSPTGHALALDKVLAKVIWKNNDLPTPDFWVFNSADEDLSAVKYPVIVKPKMESVSFGLRVVDNESDLKDAVLFIVSEFQQQALVEQFIPGREFCVGLLGNSPVETFPVLEIDLEGDPDAIQSVEDKKHTPRGKICPANIPDELAERMKKISIDAFRTLNLRDFARVDIRLDQQDNIYLLEINSMASLGETGSYTEAARVAGLDYMQLVNRMLDVASVRYFSEGILKTEHDGHPVKTLSISTRISTFLKTRQQLTEKVLKKIVDKNTHFRNVEGVNYCNDIIKAELGYLGFTSEVHPQIEVGNINYFCNANGQELDYLFLLSVDNRIKLADQESYKENEQYLEGTAIWENKGGIMVVISALQALRFVRKLRKVRIGILLSTDTSIDNKYSKAIILQKAAGAKTVLSFSGSTRDGGLTLTRSGSALFSFETKLVKQGPGENISQTASLFTKTIASITAISSGNPENLIAPYNIQFSSNIFRGYAYGSAGISVRYKSINDLTEIESRIKSIISPLRKKKMLNIHFEGSQKRPPMANSDITDNYFSFIRKIATGIDVRVTQNHSWSSSDICYIDENTRRMDGLGPTGDSLPFKNEQIFRHSLVERAHLLVMLLLAETTD